MGLGKLLDRSEEHTSELQSHSEISYAVFCLKKKKKKTINHTYTTYFTINTIKTSYTYPFSLLLFLYLFIFYTFFFSFFFFFFNDTATTEIYTLSYTLSLHDALPISPVTFRNLVCRLLLVTG